MANEQEKEKKIFYNLSDNFDLSDLTLASLDDVKEHILNDIATFNLMSGRTLFILSGRY